MIIAASSVSQRNKLNTNILEQIGCARGDGFFACELHACFREQRLSEEDIDAALKEDPEPAGASSPNALTVGIKRPDHGKY
jgi:hypothetical protein